MTAAEGVLYKCCIVRPVPKQISWQCAPPSRHLYYACLCMLSLFCSKGNGLLVIRHEGTEGE